MHGIQAPEIANPAFVFGQFDYPTSFCSPKEVRFSFTTLVFKWMQEAAVVAFISPTCVCVVAAVARVELKIIINSI